MKTIGRTISFCIVFSLSTSVALAAKSPKQSAIASAHPLATEAGHEILAAGGNAFDAAVAVASTLAVVEPYSSGLGGGGFFLLHQAKGDKDVMLDARETAPLAATKNMYLDKKGQAVAKLSREGPLSAGIPGLPAALEKLADDYGNLPLSKSLAPAIRYAREGFKTNPRYREMTSVRLELLQRHKSSAAIFLVDGKAPESSILLKQTDLATTLQFLAERGAKGFYRGDFATQFVAVVNKAGGIWSKKDLSSYRVIEREPVRGRYGDVTVTSAALPSSGGIVLLNTLNILSNFDFSKLAAVDRKHITVEALRRAYRDRAEYLGDSDFVYVPTKKLLHPFYAAGQASSIRLDKATPSQIFTGASDAKVGADTSHFSIIDTEGNRVAATLSINMPFGSGFVVPGTGILLNNEMDDFAVKSGTANAYGLVAGKNNPNAVFPGKRMLSSMSPTFLETKDRLAIIGTPGGSRIISMVLLGTLDFAAGADAKFIVKRPRFHHQFLPDQIFFEAEAFDQDTRLELQLRGHRLVQSSGSYGNMQLVIWDKLNNKLSAASDPRGGGLAEVR